MYRNGPRVDRTPGRCRVGVGLAWREGPPVEARSRRASFPAVAARPLFPGFFTPVASRSVPRSTRSFTIGLSDDSRGQDGLLRARLTGGTRWRVGSSLLGTAGAPAAPLWLRQLALVLGFAGVALTRSAGAGRERGRVGSPGRGAAAPARTSRGTPRGSDRRSCPSRPGRRTPTPPPSAGGTPTPVLFSFSFLMNLRVVPRHTRHREQLQLLIGRRT